MDKLSHVLLDNGFFCALGTSEHHVIPRNEALVKRGVPNTYDSNNGISVVNDEEGRPWIILNSSLTDEAREALRPHKLKYGAYVPHSNDGGNFVRSVIPTL